MPVPILAPPLSQTMDTVTIVEWLKQPGDTVTQGEPLYVIETDKANLEVEAPASGVLAEILAAAGTEVKVKSVIGTLTAPGESAVAPVAAASAPAAVVTPAAVAPVPAAVISGPRSGRLFASPRARQLAKAESVDLAAVRPTGPRSMVVERDVRAFVEARGQAPAAPAIRATPVARRVAEAAGIDLSRVTPSQAAGRITRADVEAALGQAQPAPVAAAPVPAAPPASASVPLVGEPFSTMRRTIGRRMSESWRDAPQVTLTREVDATELLALRQRLAKDWPAGAASLSLTALFAAVTARVLARHPRLNAWTNGERLTMQATVDINVAVETERGLVAPLLRDVAGKGVVRLSAELRGLMDRALAGTATTEELAPGGFTLTNLGLQGVDAFTPIINPPQVAILGIGRVRSAPAVFEGQLCVRQMTWLSLTFDHRATDGAPAGRFLADIAALIENPSLVWL